MKISKIWIMLFKGLFIGMTSHKILYYGDILWGYDSIILAISTIVLMIHYFILAIKELKEELK